MRHLIQVVMTSGQRRDSAAEAEALVAGLRKRYERTDFVAEPNTPASTRRPLPPTCPHRIMAELADDTPNLERVLIVMRAWASGYAAALRDLTPAPEQE
jgi:hypothetical protein